MGARRRLAAAAERALSAPLPRRGTQAACTARRSGAKAPSKDQSTAVCGAGKGLAGMPRPVVDCGAAGGRCARLPRPPTHWLAHTHGQGGGCGAGWLACWLAADTCWVGKGCGPGQHSGLGPWSPRPAMSSRGVSTTAPADQHRKHGSCRIPSGRHAEAQALLPWASAPAPPVPPPSRHLSVGRRVQSPACHAPGPLLHPPLA